MNYKGIYIGPDDKPLTNDIMIMMHFVAYIKPGATFGEIRKNFIDGHIGLQVPVRVIYSYAQHILEEN
jgi:hypothetical protein